MDPPPPPPFPPALLFFRIILPAAAAANNEPVFLNDVLRASVVVYRFLRRGARWFNREFWRVMRDFVDGRQDLRRDTEEWEWEVWEVEVRWN